MASSSQQAQQQQQQTAQTLIRPAMAARQASSSSFAGEFQAARNKLPEPDLSDDESFGSPELEAANDNDSASTDDGTTGPSSPMSLTASAGDTPVTGSGAASPISPLTPLDADEPEVADGFCFAFDIDGVLIRGGKPIPEAIEAMKVLNGENEYNLRVPYIFLTNGGGKFEEERCVDLSRQLEIEVSPGQFICGHTPMREFADRYGTVLVVGGEGEKCRQVALSYGFKDVITPGDILKAHAAVAPFRKLTDAERKNSRDLLAEYGALNEVVVNAVFVFADSRDWASDLQIILDVAQSEGGRLGTRSKTFDQGPPIYFSHNDILWSAAHEHPRLGMGALRRIVEDLFAQTTGGKKLVTHAFGKPQVSTFGFAERLLKQWRATAHGLDEASPPDTVYFVGDTPESDIRGTNAMNARSENDWYSILVKTGVYQEGTEPAYKPRKLVDNVLDAVHHGIRRELARQVRKGQTLPTIHQNVGVQKSKKAMPASVLLKKVEEMSLEGEVAHVEAV